MKEVKLDFKSLIELIRAYPTERACLNHLEDIRWPTGAISPYSKTQDVEHLGYGEYICNKTGKVFTVRTNTLFDKSTIELPVWFAAIWLVTNHKNVDLKIYLGVDARQEKQLLTRIGKCFNPKGK